MSIGARTWKVFPSPMRNINTLKVGFSIDSDNNNIKSIYMEKIIYFDGLTKEILRYRKNIKIFL
jgi:hypothetical protein